MAAAPPHLRLRTSGARSTCERSPDTPVSRRGYSFDLPSHHAMFGSHAVGAVLPLKD